MSQSTAKSARHATSASLQDEGPSLRWEHPALDAVFRELSEVGALLVEVPDGQDRRYLWQLMTTVLVPQATALSLRARTFVAAPGVAEEVKALAAGGFLDAVFILVDGVSASVRAQALADLAHWPCAVVVLNDTRMGTWSEMFEARACLAKGEALLERRGHSGEQRLPCVLRDGKSAASGMAPVAPVAAPPAASLDGGVVPCWGAEAQIAGLAKVLSPLGLTPMAGQGMPGDASPVVGLIAGAWPSPWIAEAANAAAGRFPLYFLPEADLRAEDRIAAYEAGVRFVLPPRASLAEVGAALRSALGVAAGSDPVQALAKEALELAQGLRRRTQWRREEAEAVVACYLRLAVNHLGRAKVEGRRHAAVAVRLPTVAAEGLTPAWRKFLEDTVAQGLIAGLRPCDVTFIYDGVLVILSPLLNAFAAQAICRRLSNRMVELGNAAATPHAIVPELPPGASVEECARQFLQDVLRQLRSL